MMVAWPYFVKTDGGDFVKGNVISWCDIQDDDDADNIFTR